MSFRYSSGGQLQGGGGRVLEVWTPAHFSEKSKIALLLRYFHRSWAFQKAPDSIKRFWYSKFSWGYYVLFLYIAQCVITDCPICAPVEIMKSKGQVFTSWTLWTPWVCSMLFWKADRIPLLMFRTHVSSSATQRDSTRPSWNEKLSGDSCRARANAALFSAGMRFERSPGSDSSNPTPRSYQKSMFIISGN